MTREKPKAIIKIVIERIILRSVYSKFASSLIILGVGLLIPDFREFFFNRGIDLLNWAFTAASIPPYETEDSVWPIIVGLGLIFVGLVIFVIGWWIDTKKKTRQEQLDAEPVIEVLKDPSWIYLVSGDNNKDDPLISTSVNITIETGSKAFKLKKVEFFRYVDGCPMLMCTPTLTRLKTDEKIEFNANLNGPIEPYVIHEDEVVTLFLKREFRGPTMKYRFYQLERGDLEINLGYSLGNSDELETKTYFFHQDNGNLTPSRGIPKPHLMNNDVLARAVEDSVISPEECERIRSVSERRRYLYIRDGDDFLSGLPELRAQPDLLELIKDAHNRVFDARNAKFASADR